MQPAIPALGKVAADYESNPDNYDDSGNLLAKLSEPLPLFLYRGLRLRLTRNVDKPNDFVNGVSAVVLDFEPRRRSILVETETEHRLCVYPITSDDVPGGRLTYYPVKLGYADTVHKYQGAELHHVTFWPDRPGCPAAGYVALSRVRGDADYLLGGCIKPVVPGQRPPRTEVKRPGAQAVGKTSELSCCEPSPDEKGFCAHVRILGFKSWPYH